MTDLGDSLTVEPGRPAYERDPKFYRNVVCWLGSTIVVSIVSVLILYLCKGDAPDGLIAIGSATLGAMAGVFR